jgi:hypothetical protein
VRGLDQEAAVLVARAGGRERLGHSPSIGGLAERAHEALIQAHLGERIIGHLSRDGTAIEARERPRREPLVEQSTPVAQ